MLPMGTLLQGGKYKVVRFIASGGFGNTYEVVHTALGKRFALKEFFIRGVNARSGYTVTVATQINRATFDQKIIKRSAMTLLMSQMNSIKVKKVAPMAWLGNNECLIS